MARGNSGRIVIEVDPEFKNRVYVALAKRQMTMKEWFVTASKSLIGRERASGAKRKSRTPGRGSHVS